MQQRFRVYRATLRILMTTLLVFLAFTAAFGPFHQIALAGGKGEKDEKAEKAPLFSDPDVPDGMVLSYRSKIDEKAPFVKVVYTAKKLAGPEGPVYEVRSEAGDGNVVTMRLRAADLRPLFVEKRNGSNQVVQTTAYGPEEVRLSLPQKGVTRTFPNSPDLYDQEALFFAFLGFSFQEPGQAERRSNLRLFMGENGIHRMSVGVVAEEDVQVPAGELATYKLEMVPEDLVGLIAARFKTYFWYTRGPGRHGFVKFTFPAFNQISESLELPDWVQAPLRNGK